MSYGKFVLLFTLGMLALSVALPLLLAQLDVGGNPVRGILGGVLLTLLVLALDLAMWRFAPDGLERVGFRLGESTQRRRPDNEPVEAYSLGAATPIRIYRVDTGIRIIGYAAGGLIAAGGLGLGALYLAGVDVTGERPNLGPVGTGLFVLFFVVVGALMAVVMGSTRLVITAEGVEYRTLGYRIASRWENVVGIGPARYRRGRPFESLLLSHPGEPELGLLGRIVRSLLSYPKNAIPIEGFGSPNYGPLSRDLRRYAPKLFDATGQPLRRETPL